MTSDRKRTYYSRVGQKGQITLPQEIREQLGIKPKDYVQLAAVTIEGDCYVRVERRRPLILELKGIANPGFERLDWDEIQREAKAAEARRILAEEDEI